MVYEVEYNDSLITISTQNVDPEKCSSIFFENTGTDNATINGNIPLNAGDVREFNNLPNEIISKPFKITFAGGAGTTAKVLVIRKFVKKLS